MAHAIRIDELDAIIRLWVVRGSHHEANCEAAAAARTQGRESAHAKEGGVEDLGLGPEAGGTVGEVHARVARADHRCHESLRGDLFFDLR